MSATDLVYLSTFTISDRRLFGSSAADLDGTFTSLASGEGFMNAYTLHEAESEFRSLVTLRDLGRLDVVQIYDFRGLCVGASVKNILPVRALTADTVPV